jgi:mRNA-degrading endonuclease YafQ of YafQ-DinJ toxin-antitoxin module
MLCCVLQGPHWADVVDVHSTSAEWDVSIIYNITHKNKVLENHTFILWLSHGPHWTDGADVHSTSAEWDAHITYNITHKNKVLENHTFILWLSHDADVDLA